jgi:hypothetical protein
MILHNKPDPNNCDEQIELRKYLVAVYELPLATLFIIISMCSIIIFIVIPVRVQLYFS